MKRNYMYFTLLLCLCSFLCSCSSSTIADNNFDLYYKKCIEYNLRITLPATNSIIQYRSGSSFHGDGYFSIQASILPSEASALTAQLCNSEQWCELPLPEDEQLLLYGGRKGAVVYDYCFAQNVNIPLVQQGYYYFENLNTDKTTSRLLEQSSHHFKFGIYDSDADILYYCEYRT